MVYVFWLHFRLSFIFGFFRFYFYFFGSTLLGFFSRYVFWLVCCYYRSILFYWLFPLLIWMSTSRQFKCLSIHYIIYLWPSFDHIYFGYIYRTYVICSVLHLYFHFYIKFTFLQKVHIFSWVLYFQFLVFHTWTGPDILKGVLVLLTLIVKQTVTIYIVFTLNDYLISSLFVLSFLSYDI